MLQVTDIPQTFQDVDSLHIGSRHFRTFCCLNNTGFRRRASEIGKEVITIKTMKGEFGSRDDIPDPGFLQTWYQLDENVVPPVYRLNKIR